MKVLFVCSGNSGKAGTLVHSQAESLFEAGLKINFFLIRGKGLFGYLKNIYPLYKLLKNNNYDVIHAHYSLSAFIASIAGAKPLIVSLMGSDVKSGLLYRLLIQFFYRFYKWNYLIVKSEDLRTSLKIDKAQIIPNGVNIDQFRPMDQAICRAKLGWEEGQKHVLFAANPNRPEKNYKITKDAVKICNDGNSNSIQLHVLDKVEHNDVVYHFNAADVIILSSIWEGSPNVVKESMACNRPIVSTRVGDVEWLFGEEPGYYLAGFQPEDIAIQLRKAFDLTEGSGSVNGRQRIIDLKLDSSQIAGRIAQLYEEVAQIK